MLEKLRKEIEQKLYQLININKSLGELCKSQYELLLHTSSTEEDFIALNNDVRFIIELYEKEG